MTSSLPTQATISPNNNRFFDTDHLKDDLKGRSVRGGAATLAGQWANFLFQMVSTVILARLLTPADFGLIAMVTAVTGFASLFKDLGLSMATVQKAEITHEQISVLFWVNVAVSFLITLITASLAPVIAWFYGEPRLIPVTIALSFAFVCGGLTVQHQALLRRQMRFTTLAVIPVVAMAVAVFSAIIAAFLGLGYWSLVVMELARAAANALAVWLACRWWPGLPNRGTGVRGMLRFGANLTGFNILNYFTRNADNVIIGYALGTSALGIYTKAYGLLALPIQQINGPVTGVMLPTLCRLQADPDRYRRYYLHTLSAIAAVTMPIIALLYVAANEVVLIVLGDQWITAVDAFRWLAPAAFFGSINFAPGWLCVSLGRTYIQLRWAMLSAPIIVIGFLAGVHWGINGVAGAFSLTWCALFVLFLSWASHQSPVRFADIARYLAAPVLASVIAALLTAYCGSIIGYGLNPVIRFVFCGIMFGVTYMGCLMVSPGGRRLIGLVKSLPSLLRGRSFVAAERY